MGWRGRVLPSPPLPPHAVPPSRSEPHPPVPPPKPPAAILVQLLSCPPGLLQWPCCCSPRLSRIRIQSCELRYYTCTCGETKSQVLVGGVGGWRLRCGVRGSCLGGLLSIFMLPLRYQWLLTYTGASCIPGPRHLMGTGGGSVKTAFANLRSPP